MNEAKQRVALVTGANKSIGFQVAKELAREGCTVYLGARKLQAGKEAADRLAAENLKVHPIELDLLNQETIDAAAARIEKEQGRLDILVNNAGIIYDPRVTDKPDGAPSKTSLEAVETTMKTNFFGTLAVTQAMLPLLRHAASEKRGTNIVNVSSDLGSITGNADPNWKYSKVKFLGYSASKAALNMLTAQLAVELREEGIKVNSSNPGFTKTDFNNHQGTLTVEEGAAETIRLALASEDGATGGYFETAGPLPW